MDNSKRSRGIQAAIASAVFLGASPILGKAAFLQGFTPYAVVALRTGIAALLLILLMAVFKRQYFYIYPVGLAGCVLAGFFNGLGSIFYYIGLSRLDASIGQLIYAFYPVFVAGWMLLDRQSLNRVTLLRLAVALPGIHFLLSTGDRPVDLTGALFMLVSAILYALHLIINQRILYEVPAQTVTLYTLLSMTGTVVIAFLLLDQKIPQPTLNFTPILLLAFITFFSRVTLFLGVKHLGSIQTAILGLGELLVTVALAHWWLGESLSLSQWMGVFFLVLSLFLVIFDRQAPAKKYSSSWLSWLNPPKIDSTDLNWHSQP